MSVRALWVSLRLLRIKGALSAGILARAQGEKACHHLMRLFRLPQMQEDFPQGVMGGLVLRGQLARHVQFAPCLLPSLLSLPALAEVVVGDGGVRQTEFQGML